MAVSIFLCNFATSIRQKQTIRDMATLTNQPYDNFIHGLSFKDAIDFFDFIITDMMQEENHAMYDITTKQGMVDLLNQHLDVDMNSIYKTTAEYYPKQIVAVWAIDNGITLCTPQQALMNYKDWFLDHLDTLNKGVKDRAYIDEKYPGLLISLFGRDKMIGCIDKMIEMLTRNRKRLADGLFLENEHWTDIAGLFREHLELFSNFNQKKK